jgi:hypothetical protein
MKTAKEQRTHLLQVAATFDIVVNRKVQGRAATVSSTIGEAFKERVSALRSWQPPGASSVPPRHGVPDDPDSNAMERTGGEDPSAEGEVADTSLRQRGKKRPAPKLHGMNLARYMVPKVANSELASPKSITIDDIVTIQDAGCYVRQHLEFVPRALAGRVFQVMFKLSQQQARALAGFYGFKTKFWLAGKTVDESPAMVQYELERRVVAELESLPRLAATSSAASSSGDVVRAAEPSGDAPMIAVEGLEAAPGLKQTPRNVEELVAA